MPIKTTVALFSCALFACALLADEPKKPQPSPEEKAMMEAMMKAGSPGPEHKKLDAMVGDFDAKITMWGAPGAPPDVSTGVSHNRWTLGGRWVEQRYSGNFMGTKFEGIGYTGYDNITKMYVGTWMDTMSTGTMMSTGTLGADGTYTFNGTTNDISGKQISVKEVVTVTDRNHHMMEMWSPGPDGQPFKMMEIRYTRK